MAARASRVTALDWIEAAAQALAQEGPDALTIDALCVRLKKTKGSFYAHFGSHEAFLAALTGYWRERSTQSLINAVEDHRVAKNRLAVLNRLAMRVDFKLDQAMRRLGERYPAVADAVAAVDATRIAYLAQLHRAAGVSSKVLAHDLAMIEYAAYVGLQQIRPERSRAEMARLYRTFSGMLVRRD